MTKDTTSVLPLYTSHNSKVTIYEDMIRRYAFNFNHLGRRSKILRSWKRYMYIIPQSVTNQLLCKKH